ncbi:MAG TPA: hypothetical protein VFM09_11820 [Marmoricola sp.]|nr:hypothetical protein [Marmoricola sp.]
MRHARATAVVLVAVLLLAVLGACSSGSTSAPSLRQRAAAARTAVRAAEQRLLAERARAVRDHDLPGFLRAVDPGDHRLVRRERRLFGNLAQLPLRRFGYRLVGHRVRQVMQLAGYDAVPVRQPVATRFGRVHGRLRVVADGPGPRPRPWDLTRIHVERGRGVLGIFDGAMWPQARVVVDAVQAARRQVTAAVPFTWDDHVVVYSFATPRVLSAFRDVPGGGSITHLGAMTFPVYSDPGGGRLASMRFVVLPSSVQAGQPFLGRIVRHELTHVAVGDHDDGDPVWISEGIAEYVGARPVPPAQRRIPRIAVELARQGVSAMPASADFNGAEQEWNYALAWMACDYIAATQGESTLWRLMEALHAHGKGTRDSRQDPVLRRVLGYDSHELARRAAARILSIYG